MLHLDPRLAADPTWLSDLDMGQSGLQSPGGARWHSIFTEAVRLVIAPAVCLCIGFFTADFLLSGVYTWPRASRVIALTLTVVVLSYEFVFKEQGVRAQGASPNWGLKAVVYSCAAPYVLGFLSLMGLARLSS
jgi:hypothetical protein